MTITTPPAGLPPLTTNTGAIALDRLDRAPTPTSPATPGSPASTTGGATPPRRLSTELGGLSARRTADSSVGPSRGPDSALAPRRSLEQLRRSASPQEDGAPPTVPSTRSSSPTPTTIAPATTALTPPAAITPAATTPAATTTDHGHAPREAGAGMFFLMQNVRHALPVAGVRTVVQGVIAPELARAVASHPDAALAAQTALTAYSLGRRIVSQIHSESSAQVANQAFSGDAAQRDNSLPRRVWQGVQSAGIAGGDFAALALTIAARSNPALTGVAQAAAAIQVVAHLQAQFREALRPAINTVHVGNGDRNVAQPPEGRNLRQADVTWGMRGTFGAAAAVIDLGTQLLMQQQLGGQPAWQAARGLAVRAGAIAGAGNMLTSSVEDHLVDTASALRMRQTTAGAAGSESHVRHIHIDLRNPFTRNELGRQAERADTRIFNTMVPGLIALGVVQALQSTLSQPGVSAPERQAAQAGVHAAVAGLVGGALLALTVASYQLNDTVRSRNASQRAAARGAQP
jgi:hypothetical protein